MVAAIGLETELRVKLADYEKQMLRAQNKTDAALRNIENRFTATNRRVKKESSDLGNSLGGALSGLKGTGEQLLSSLPGLNAGLGNLGVAGTVAALGVGALALAVTQAKAAMAFADEIDDASQKLNIGTTALQEYRFAMTEVGGEAKDADTAIANFTKTLGLAQSGLSPKAMKGFEALGFTREQLDSFDSGEEALAEVAQRISALSKESERAAVVEKLGLEPMLPLLREGADRMEELRQRARDLGIVMEEDLVKAGADANQQFETMAEIIKVQMASAFVGLSDEIVAFTGFIADALKGLNDFLKRWEEFSQMRGNGSETGIFGIGNAGAAFGYSSGLWDILPWTQDRARRLHEGEDWAAANSDDPALMRQQMAAQDAQGTDQRQRRERSTSETRLSDVSSRRTGGGTGRAERDADQRQRREDAFAQELARAQAELLRAFDRSSANLDEETANKVAQAQADHAAALADIARREQEYARSDGLRGLAKAEADQLRAHEATLLATREAAIAADHRRAQAEMNARIEDQQTTAALALLEARAASARTDEARVLIDREILSLHQLERRRHLERAIVQEGISDAEKAILRAMLDNLEEIEKQERDRLRTPAQQAAQDAIDASRDRASSRSQPEADRDAGMAYVDQQVAAGLDYQAAADARLAIDQAYWRAKLLGEGQMLSQLASLQSSSIKELAAIGKAAAITQATIDGFLAVQNALAHGGPFPANLVAATIVGAQAAANVAGIMGTGFKSGGYTGNLGENEIAGAVHGKEFVFDAPAVRRIGVPALEAIRAGGLSADRVNAMTAGALTVTSASPAPVINFNPSIDARGADAAAIRRLEAAMEEQGRALAREVGNIMDRRERFRMGGRRP